MWAQRTLSTTRGPGAGIGEQLSFRGAAVSGFSLAAAGDPQVWTTLTPDQQAWVGATFAKLNDMIVKSTGTTCPTWAPSVDKASGCFQPWYNSMYVGSPGFKMLRTDGVFDADTLQALITTALIHQSDFPTPFPGTPPSAASKGLSKGAMAGIAVGGATVLGGIIYAATRGGGKKKARRRSR